MVLKVPKNKARSASDSIIASALSRTRTVGWRLICLLQFLSQYSRLSGNCSGHPGHALDLKAKDLIGPDQTLLFSSQSKARML